MNTNTSRAAPAMSLARIAFECIREPYYWGQYGDIRVIINIENGYINATHLCASAKSKGGKPKQFPHWKENNDGLAVLAAAESSLGIPRDQLIHFVSGGQIIELRGSYIHPKLVPPVACWASPEFGMIVSDIVNNHFIRQHEGQIAMQAATINAQNRDLADKAAIIGAKDTKIDELKSMIEAQTAKIDALLADSQTARREHETVLEELDNISTEAKDNHDQLAVANANVAAIATRLNVAVVDRVPPDPVDGRAEVFVVLNKPGTGEYKVVRRQQRTLMSAIRTCANAGYTRQVCRVGSPNAINIWNRIKEQLLPRLATISGGYYIILAAGASEAALLAFIRAVESQKRAV